LNNILECARQAREAEEVNQYGCPLHACFGYRHDAHYWAWIRATFVRDTQRDAELQQHASLHAGLRAL